MTPMTKTVAVLPLDSGQYHSPIALSFWLVYIIRVWILMNVCYDNALGSCSVAVLLPSVSGAVYCTTNWLNLQLWQVWFVYSDKHEWKQWILLHWQVNCTTGVKHDHSLSGIHTPAGRKGRKMSYYLMFRETNLQFYIIYFWVRIGLVTQITKWWNLLISVKLMIVLIFSRINFVWGAVTFKKGKVQHWYTLPEYTITELLSWS